MHLLLSLGGKLWLLQRPRLSRKTYRSFENTCVKCAGVALGYANAQPPGRDKNCECPTPGLTVWANAPRLPGGGSMGTARIDWCITQHHTLQAAGAHHSWGSHFSPYAYINRSHLIVSSDHREQTILLSREKVNKGAKRMDSLPFSRSVTS